MVRVLDSTQRLLYLIGCQYVDRSNLPTWYRPYRYFAFIWMSSMFLPFLTFLLLVDSDLESVAQALTMLAGESVVMLKTLLVHRHAHHLIAVLETLQADMNQNAGNSISSSSTLFSGRHFIWAERLSHRLALVNNWSLFLAAVTIIVSPAMLIVLHLLSGTYTPDLLNLPSECLMPMDVHTIGGYALGYAWEIMFNIYIMSTFMATDGLFIGLCVYALAYLEDLVERLARIDEEYLRSANALVLRADLVGAVKQHLHIKGWFNRVARLFSEMILIQFGSGGLLISNFVYQCQMSDGGNVAIFVMISCSLLGQMFIYCYASTRVAYKFLWTADAVYNMNWYRYPVRLQPFILAMLQQLQKLRYLSGMGIVKCSLESFKSLLNFIGTLIAVLQSMK